MKKFAKISAVLAAMALAFSFAGCSDGSSGGGSDSSEITGGETSGGETSGGETSGGETSGGETSGGETSGGETSGGETSGGETSGGETSGGETSGGETSGDGEIPKDFVKVPAVSINGSETWTPASKVFVSGRKLEIKAFWMSDHEVTQAEWKEVMDRNLPENMAPADGTADNNPVNMVSWYDAIVYCNKRSIKEGLTPCYTINGFTNLDDWGDVPPTATSNYTWNAAICDFTANGYRLPTEAEWEWAARGGSDNTTYAGSNNIGRVAWCDSSSSSKTHEVKTLKANGYRLYDMSGNVWEWCWDWYDSIGSILSSTPKEGVSSGSFRVRRGGSWYGYDYYCEVARRYQDSPDDRFNYLGFRVVRSCD